MWPYDYFNQNSIFINEFRIERNNKIKTRKVFVSREYSKYKSKEEERKRFFEALIQKINKRINKRFILCDRNSVSCNGFLSHKFEVEMPNKAGKDDINKKILSNIMESYLVICDVTPRVLEKRKFIINENVMAELGMSLAWKMPEQVIILSDRNKTSKKYELPFNIRGYFVHYVDFKNEKEKIIEIIESRDREMEHGKSIIIKNIISKLDGSSLRILESNLGLNFAYSKRVFKSKEHTIRHLLNLGLIKTQIFPLTGGPTRTYTYQLTELARVVLERLGSLNIFDQRFDDFMYIYWWSGHKNEHKKEYQDRLDNFCKDYGISWERCDGIFRKFLAKEHKYFLPDGNMWKTFNHFRKGKPFRFTKEKLVIPWGKQVDKLIVDK